jgi:hypothetical protein
MRSFRGEDDAMSPRRRAPAGLLDDDDGRGLEAEANDPAAAFRARIEEGDYRRLLGAAMHSVIQQAAAEPGLDEEIGMLRVVLARLLVEEGDPAKLAAGAARIAHVAVQAARARHALQGQQADNLTEAITQILTELDGE